MFALSARRRASILALGLALGGPLGACGAPPNELGGSTTKGLHFDEVKVVAGQGSLTVTYQAKDTTVPAKLVITAPTELAAGKPFSLAGPTFLKMTKLERHMVDPKDIFPEVVQGSLEMTQVASQPGQKVAGSFLLFFVDDRTSSEDANSGASLRGSFTATIAG